MPTHCTITCFGFHARWIDGTSICRVYCVLEKVEVRVTVSVTVCVVCDDDERKGGRVQILFFFYFYFIYFYFILFFCLLEGVRSHSSTPVNMHLGTSICIVYCRKLRLG